MNAIAMQTAKELFKSIPIQVYTKIGVIKYNSKMEFIGGLFKVYYSFENDMCFYKAIVDNEELYGFFMLQKGEHSVHAENIIEKKIKAHKWK